MRFAIREISERKLADPPDRTRRKKVLRWNRWCESGIPNDREGKPKTNP